MGFFSNMKDWDPNDLAQGGIIGASIMAKSRKKAEELRARPKPGKYCSPVCQVNDGRCKECMKCEKRFIASLKKLEKLESLSEMSDEEVKQAVKKRAAVKCSLCGAPHESGSQACPYCRTEYPQDCIDFDVPLSKGERNSAVMQLAQDTWDIYVERSLLINKFARQSNQGGKKQGFFAKMLGGLVDAAEKMLPHTAAEIKEGAEHYNVSLSEYIHGVATEQMQMTKLLKMEEENRRMQEESRRRNEMMAQQQAQRAASSSYTPMDYYARRAQNTSYGYSGGYNRYCGECMYFYGGNQCTQGQHPNGASDSCGLWKMK